VNAGDKHGRRSRECCQRDASQGAAHDVWLCGGDEQCLGRRAMGWMKQWRRW
jgi:hypothetical protein